MRVALLDDRMYEKVAEHCGAQRSGCYRLFAVDRAAQTWPIQRMLGLDTTGTLYIGASFSLPDRLATLKKSALAAHAEVYLNRHIHPVGRKLTDQAMRHFGGTAAYHVQVYQQPLSADPADRGHFREEGAMLKAYHEVWGEYPPLNG